MAFFLAAFVAAFLAGRNIEGRGWPYWGQLGLIILCMVAARSAAMTFNRIVDASIIFGRITFVDPVIEGVRAYWRGR